MSFAHPALALLSALSFPLALIAQRFTSKMHRRTAYNYSNLLFMTGALNAPEWPNAALDLLCAAALALMLAATAGPRVWIARPVSAAVALCIDTSGSMNARDVRPTRALAAVQAVRALVHTAPPRMRFAIVAFAGFAHPVAALTDDRSELLQRLTDIPAPNGQTAIGDGLRAAAQMLPESGLREIVLMTDGANNRGEDPRAVVRRLAESHIRLDTLAIGNVSAEPSLRAYALQTGGVFARAKDAGTLSADLLRLTSRRFALRAPRDWTLAFVAAALSLGAAAWLATAGAARL